MDVEAPAAGLGEVAGLVAAGLLLLRRVGRLYPGPGLGLLRVLPQALLLRVPLLLLVALAVLVLVSLAVPLLLVLLRVPVAAIGLLALLLSVGVLVVQLGVVRPGGRASVAHGFVTSNPKLWLLACSRKVFSDSGPLLMRQSVSLS